MKVFIAEMVQEDPVKRPTMDEVVARFSEIKNKLSTWKLRPRLIHKKEIIPVKVWRTVGRWYRTVSYALSRKAAIPDPQ